MTEPEEPKKITTPPSNNEPKVMPAALVSHDLEYKNVDLKNRKNNF